MDHIFYKKAYSGLELTYIRPEVNIMDEEAKRALQDYALGNDIDLTKYWVTVEYHLRPNPTGDDK